jgi:prepilin-type N-terminal cleavage/methylation domain-containing protein/prepilin-type processing-associated H-X9-DG protein
MKNQSKERWAFTLIELSVVIAIVAILAAMCLTALARPKPRAQRAGCANNLKQQGIAFATWAMNQNDAYPMSVPTARGGPPNQTQIMAGTPAGSAYYLYQIFGVMSNEVSSARLLACPADLDTVVHSNLLIVLNATRNVEVPGSGIPVQYSLADVNCSYFVGLDADDNYPSMLLCGDRNIYGSAALDTLLNTTINNGYGDANHPGSGAGSPAMVVMGTNFAANAVSPAWTGKIHQNQGNVLLCDGSVQQLTSPRLRTQLVNSGDTTAVPGPNALLFP